jgi:hypothetical protein
MGTCQAVADLLDETIDALAVMDLDRLQVLEERSAALCGVKINYDKNIHPILMKKRVLELVLQSSAESLNAMDRLRDRNVRSQWAR